jgi:hypothetical protein
MTVPWQVDDEREPLRGPVIRALLEHRDRLMAIDPWLEFPQEASCFSFGVEGRPLPIGALFALWDSCSEMVGRGPDCGDDGYGLAFGGGLAVGGVLGACTCAPCSRRLWRPLGGLATVGRILSPYLQGTPFVFKTGALGGTVGSDGRELLAQLRLLGARA